MLTFLGSRKVACDGLTRRDLLHVGSLGLFGLGLSDFFGLRASQAAPAHPTGPAHFGKARSCILVYLFGAPASHETFDPKPAAPAEVQGEMKAVATRVPGAHVGEGLPRVAGILDRLTVVRSLTHAWPFHGVHYAVSGIPAISKTVEADPNDRTLWPFIGSVVDCLGEQRRPAAHVPRNIALPFVLYSRAKFRPLGGPYAGFLGPRYDPVWTAFAAPGTRPVPNPTAKPDEHDPYGGIRPEDRFDLTGGVEPPTDLTPERVGPRRVARRLAALRRLTAYRRARQRRHYRQTEGECRCPTCAAGPVPLAVATGEVFRAWGRGPASMGGAA